MGKYSIPSDIRAMKPKGTMAKVVDGKYYFAYAYKTIYDEDGKKHTKMGKIVGKLDPILGFVPNDNYPSWYEERCKQKSDKKTKSLVDAKPDKHGKNDPSSPNNATNGH